MSEEQPVSEPIDITVHVTDGDSVETRAVDAILKEADTLGCSIVGEPAFQAHAYLKQDTGWVRVARYTARGEQ